MEKSYSQHLFKLLLALLMVSAAVMLTLAYRTSVQEKHHNAVSLSRSADATAREIELYISGLQRVLGLFAVEQQSLLSDVINYPEKIETLREKISLHFPEHLAFAVSDPSASSPLISQPELFGDSCRANLNFHSQNNTSLEPALFLHDSGSIDNRHFDVMATIMSATSDAIGIVFVSFQVNNLTRFLTSGSVSTHTLLLENKHDIAGSKPQHIFLVGNTEVALGSPTGGFSQKQPDYTVAIAGTSWVLQGFIDKSGTTKVSNAAFIQMSLGLMALLVAGITAWWSIEQEKISRNRASIVLASVESDRKRIARELHDQVLSDISHSKRLLMDFELNSADQSQDQLITVQQSVEQFSTNIRSTINDLYPHILDNLGLCKALEAYVQSRCFTRVNYHLQCDSCIEHALEPMQKLHIYRIVAELVNNALQHTLCDTISISIRQVKRTILLRFEDNGIGFDAKAARCSGGHGLGNIDSRTLALGAFSQWNGSCFELTINADNHVNQ